MTKSSTARFSHKNLVEKFKIFVQDFVPIRTALFFIIPIFMGTKYWTKILNLHRISPTRFCFTFYYTGFYGDKILCKNLDLTQDFPNKILFHFLWAQNLVQKSSRIFTWPEMCSLGKILAQDFQMAAVTKILMRRDKSIAPLLSLGDKHIH